MPKNYKYITKEYPNGIYKVKLEPTVIYETQISYDSSESTELDYKNYDELVDENVKLLAKIEHMEKERLVQKLREKDLLENNEFLFRTIQDIITKDWRNYK